MILTVKKNKLFPFLFHFSEKLRRQHRNTNDPIIKYMDCEMEVQMNFQKSILMKGVKLEKSSEKQVCFNHKQRTFDKFVSNEKTAKILVSVFSKGPPQMKSDQDNNRDC
ncbi:unnamed protein product [Schistosoma turkestanicum]|nr:unnamed protein product [Schistosoma turkestanicum]